jgi:hypothetical protein
MSALKLLSVNVGMPREVDWHGRLVRTSTFKSPISGPVRVATLNLEGENLFESRIPKVPQSKAALPSQLS